MTSHFQLQVATAAAADEDEDSDFEQPRARNTKNSQNRQFEQFELPSDDEAEDFSDEASEYSMDEDGNEASRCKKRPKNPSQFAQAPARLTMDLMKYDLVAQCLSRTQVANIFALDVLCWHA